MHGPHTLQAPASRREAFAAEFLPRGLQRAFETFDANFELGASPLPHALQPRFLSARSRLLSFMREALARGLLEGSLALETVRQSGVSNKCWPNMLLTLLWASQANTAASLFWSVAFLLLPQHGRFLRRILEDVRDALGGEKQDRAAVGEGEGEEEEGGGGSVEACLEVISGQGVESVAEVGLVLESLPHPGALGTGH